MLRSRKSSSVDWMEHSVLRGGDTETGFWVEWLIFTETVRCKCELPDYASHLCPGCRCWHVGSMLLLHRSGTPSDTRLCCAHSSAGSRVGSGRGELQLLYTSGQAFGCS